MAACAKIYFLSKVGRSINSRVFLGKNNFKMVFKFYKMRGNHMI